MTAQRFKVIQVLLEATIPILGIFLWEWSLYFIILFYILDLFADHVFLHVKSKRVVKENSSAGKGWSRYGIGAGVLLFLSLLLAHFTVLNTHPGIDFLIEIKNFWTYEELGIQQGYVLLPMLFFAAYQQYKMEFLLPARYRSMDMQTIWLPALRSFYLLFAFTSLAFGLSFWVNWSDTVYVLAIVMISSLYKLLELKK
jgi:hypothetical protein